MPDYLAEFQQRERVYQEMIHEQARTTQDYLRAYAQYEQFLDKELNQAYRSLSSKLPPEQFNDLKRSQREWIKYRDAASSQRGLEEFWGAQLSVFPSEQYFCNSRCGHPQQSICFCEIRNIYNE